MNHIAIDLFAGAGGFGLGFKLAGFDVPLSLEIDAWASDTLRVNNPGDTVVQADIRVFDTREKIRQVCPDKPDVIIGGPPCQGFSISGPAQKDPKDPRNSLFVDYARWVEVLEPRVFIMENVKGLLSRRNADAKPVIDIITSTFERIGYSVSVWVLNAAEYGVPQVRERIFVVGVPDRTLDPPPSTHTLIDAPTQIDLFRPTAVLPAVSLWDAISDLPPLEAGEGEEEVPYATDPLNDYQQWARRNSTHLWNHVAMNHSRRLVERFSHIQWGESSANVPKEHGPRSRGNNGVLSERVYDQNNRRLHPNKPSHTIAASFYANFVHPFQHRNLTAREGARVQSFPDVYKFMGKSTVVSHKLLLREGRNSEIHLCQYNQIGNAVPPLLARSIATYILGECFDVASSR